MKKKKIKVENIDHCGIVAGIIDEIGLVEKIDEKVGSGHVQELVSAGIAVKAMIINGLGFVSAPLYLFAKFYEEKGIENLLGKGIKAENLNDDKLGRVLDKLYEAGITEIFVEIALEGMERLGVKREKVHLDSTSFKVEGEYEKEEGEEVGIEIVEGYSRDKRPDLKQYMLQMICSGDGDIPMYIRVGSGNESDKKMFGEIIKEYRENWEVEALWVADAELYNAENIEKLGEIKWLSRVPSTIKGV
ncbi:MAG: IS1634 family transposase, partial [Microcoleaceae cyanobacterium]